MQLIEIFVYLGTIAAGISGAVAGIERRLDMFGVTSLCVATSLGGGIVRDLLIGEIPPVAFVHPKYFLASLSAGLLTWIFYPYVSRFKSLLMVSDAVGLGVFTAIGANSAINHGFDEPFIVVSMGLITGIGGGVVRDVFTKEIPYVFRKEVYAVASIVGAVAFMLLSHIFSVTFAMYACLIITFAVRVLSVIFSLNFPVYRLHNSHDKKQEG